MRAPDFAKTYSEMSNDQLARLDVEHNKLLPEARVALDAELTRRGLGASFPSSDTQPPESAEPDTRDAWKGRFRSALLLLIFLALSFAASFLVQTPTGLSGADTQNYEENIGKFAAYWGIILWGVSSIFGGPWLKFSRALAFAVAANLAGVYFLNASWPIHRESAVPAIQNSADPQRGIADIEAEFKRMAPAARQGRQELSEVLLRRPEDFAGFEQQMSDLATLLDAAEPRSRRGQQLARQVRERRLIDDAHVDIVKTAEHLYEDDAKMYAILRDEIACARRLTSQSSERRNLFAVICQEPAYDKLDVITARDAAMLRELKKHGVHLPPDLLEDAD